jgi:hypothetical protein
MSVDQAIRNAVRDELQSFIEEFRPHSAGKHFFTLNEAFERKGGMNWKTFYHDSLYHPRGGKPDAYVHGKKVWKAETIEVWLGVDDHNLAEYLDACGRSLSPTEKAKLAVRVQRVREQIGEAS